MEYQRMKKRSFIAEPVWRRWLIAIGIVWMVLALIYAFQTIQIRKHERILTNTGLSIIQTFSEQAGLPLLEQNIIRLREMLNDLGKQPDLLYATVVDHKNKIIAYTDAGRLLPPRESGTSSTDGVETWQDEEAMIFSKAILFSETPIGEIRLAFTRASIVKSKKFFTAIAALSISGLVLTWLALHGRILVGWLNRRRGRSGVEMDDHLLHCPLCGQDVENSGAFYHLILDADKNLLVRLSEAFSGRDGSSVEQLAEIGTNPGLASIKGQMIRQCAEIISKLSVDDGRSGKQARENIQ